MYWEHKGENQRRKGFESLDAEFGLFQGLLQTAGLCAEMPKKMNSNWTHSSNKVIKIIEIKITTFRVLALCPVPCYPPIRCISFNSHYSSKRELY